MQNATMQKGKDTQRKGHKKAFQNRENINDQKIHKNIIKSVIKQ